MIMESEAPSLLSDLRAKPARLQQEIEQVNSSLTALSVAHYSVHVANAHCEADVKHQLRSTSSLLPSVTSTATKLQAAVDSTLPSLTKLHAKHTHLSVIQSQQSVLLELLETPALMDSCLRAGMYDEALDINEFATNLYFTHRLWEADGASGATSPRAAAARKHDKGIIRAVVEDVRRLAGELHEQLFSQLSAKNTLPQIIKLISFLRRLYTQHTIALKRQEHVTNGRLNSTKTLETHFSLSLSEEYAVVARVRVEFLRCRDAWHRSELESISKHNAYQYILRVLELQRAHWGDISNQYVAVTSTLRPTTEAIATPESALLHAKDQIKARNTLAQWLSHRISWFVRVLASTLPLMDDFSNISTLLQQANFISRRAGKLAVDYTHLITPLFQQRMENLVQVKFQDATQSFQADLLLWQWAYKHGYDVDGKAVRTAATPSSDAHGTTAATPSSNAHDATAASHRPTSNGVDAANQYDPPAVLIRYSPLADVTNAVLTAYASIRTCFPTSSVYWLARRLVSLFTACSNALEGAANCDGSPLLTIKSAKARGKGLASVSDDDVNAVRRYDDLCKTYKTVFVPYVLSLHALLERHVSNTTTPNAMPAELTQAMKENDAKLDAVIATNAKLLT